MRLYDLTKEQAALESLILESVTDDGEIKDSEIIEGWVSEIEGPLEVKLESIARLRANWKAEAEMHSVEAERQAKNAKILDNKRKALEAYVAGCMSANGLQKLKAGLFFFSIKGNGGKVKVDIDDVDPNTLPARFQMHPPVQIDKDAVRDAIASGEVLAFARELPRGTHLEVK